MLVDLSEVIPDAPATPADFTVATAVSVASRTLTAAGFTVTNCIRQRSHAALECERPDLLGSTVRYLVALCEGRFPPPDDIPNIRRDAAREDRLLVMVAETGGDDWLAWSDFLLALGGAVPIWRALGPGYDSALLTLSRNELPEGLKGEAWRLFEEAVADGLEFLFGRRVLRLGGAARGTRVADLLAHTPDGRLLIVDAKASSKSFDAAWPELRALGEYVQKQQARQRGGIEVAAALVVAPVFKQEPEALAAVAGEFLAERRVPVTFATASTLLHMVATARDRPRLRPALRWSNVVCQPRLITDEHFDVEVRAAERERFEPDSPPAVPVAAPGR